MFLRHSGFQTAVESGLWTEAGGESSVEGEMVREKGRRKDHGLSGILSRISSNALSMDTPRRTRRIAMAKMWDTALAKDIPYSGKTHRMRLEKTMIYFTLGSKGTYLSRKDVIRIPPRRCFTSSAFFHRALLHEIGHWTGHYSRNGRIPPPTEKLHPKWSEEYAVEELVAELFAALFMESVLEKSILTYLFFSLTQIPSVRRRSSLRYAAEEAEKAVDFMWGSEGISPWKSVSRFFSEMESGPTRFDPPLVVKRGTVFFQEETSGLLVPSSLMDPV